MRCVLVGVSRVVLLIAFVGRAVGDVMSTLFGGSVEGQRG